MFTELSDKGGSGSTDKGGSGGADKAEAATTATTVQASY